MPLSIIYTQADENRYVLITVNDTLLPATATLPARRKVSSINTKGVDGNQSRFDITLRDAGKQRLWTGTQYKLGPPDLPVYYVDDPSPQAEDINGLLIHPDGQLVITEYVPTDPQGEPL